MIDLGPWEWSEALNIYRTVCARSLCDSKTSLILLTGPRGAAGGEWLECSLLC